MLNAPPVAGPLPATALVQVELVYSFTVAHASAVPATLTAMLNAPPVARPLPATALVHVELTYSFTVAPASAVPEMLGALLLAGPAGVAADTSGDAGDAESST